MTLKALGYLALTVALVAATAGYFSGLGKDKIAASEQRNVELKAKVDALQEQARVAVDQADAAAKTAAQHEVVAKVLKARLASTKSKGQSQSHGDPVVSDGVPATGNPDVVVDDLRDQIIAAQDQQIAAQKDEIKGLRAALDLKDQARVTAEQRARGLEIALEAQRHASKSQRWLGRIEGVAVGIAIGYVGGKLQ